MILILKFEDNISSLVYVKEGLEEVLVCGDDIMHRNCMKVNNKNKIKVMVGSKYGQETARYKS